MLIQAAFLKTRALHFREELHLFFCRESFIDCLYAGVDVSSFQDRRRRVGETEGPGATVLIDATCWDSGGFEWAAIISIQIQTRAQECMFA
jgi:hypothetical protein